MPVWSKLSSGFSWKGRNIGYFPIPSLAEHYLQTEGQTIIFPYRAGTFSLALNLQKDRTPKSHLPSWATWSVCKYQSRSPCCGPISAIVFLGFRAISTFCSGDHTPFFLFFLAVSSPPSHSPPLANGISAHICLKKPSLRVAPHSSTGGIYSTVQSSDCVPPPPLPQASGSFFVVFSGDQSSTGSNISLKASKDA